MGRVHGSNSFLKGIHPGQADSAMEGILRLMAAACWSEYLAAREAAFAVTPYVGDVYLSGFSILRHYLPGDVLELTKLATLEICKDSFIEKELKDYYSDLLYRVRLGDHPEYIYSLYQKRCRKIKEESW